MTTRAPTTEERLSRLEGAYEQGNERLADLRTDVTDRLNELARGQDTLRLEVNSLRNTMLLLIGGVWATTVGGFIALFTRL